MPFPGGSHLNGGAYCDRFNPLENYPVPDHTTLTPRKPPNQGSGDMRDRMQVMPDGRLVPRGHYGLDFAVPPGTDILAPGDGVVVNTQRLDGYGNQITIKHANGITTQVAHVGSVNVKPGDKVTARQVIGISGDGKDRRAAGNAYGSDPQVHFEVRGGDGRDRKNGGIIFDPNAYLEKARRR